MEFCFWSWLLLSWLVWTWRADGEACTYIPTLREIVGIEVVSGNL